MDSAFLRVSFSSTFSLSLRPPSLFTPSVASAAVQAFALLSMPPRKESSLPPSLIPHLYDGPQDPEDSPTGSPPSNQPTLDPSGLPHGYLPPPHTLAPARAFPAYDPGVQDPSAAGPSSTHRADPILHPPARYPPPMYPGAHSLPPPIRRREGEPGSSSLGGHPYPGDPPYALPQPIYRRATEPSNYPSTQSPSSFTSSSQGIVLPPIAVLAPPALAGSEWPGYAPREGEGAAPIHARLPSHSPESVGSEERRLPEEAEPPRAPSSKKILIACDFCRRRKLRCDGNRPVCSNCRQRGTSCSYRDGPKRRGPGKAKGAQTKKRAPKSRAKAASAEAPRRVFDEQPPAGPSSSRPMFEEGSSRSRQPLYEEGPSRQGFRGTESPPRTASTTGSKNEDEDDDDYSDGTGDYMDERRR
uniref:Zn(2)-C6 fungal-type domain-containing protein n=1 Tax=Mycena chlorophos TaxID=658473 RepID=A0ABQ0MA05_MYCCL|nr:predicted protein [Mycena chlorophos]